MLGSTLTLGRGAFRMTPRNLKEAFSVTSDPLPPPLSEGNMKRLEEKKNKKKSSELQRNDYTITQPRSANTSETYSLIDPNDQISASAFSVVIIEIMRRPSSDRRDVPQTAEHSGGVNK